MHSFLSQSLLSLTVLSVSLLISDCLLLQAETFVLFLCKLCCINNDDLIHKLLTPLPRSRPSWIFNAGLAFLHPSKEWVRKRIHIFVLTILSAHSKGERWGINIFHFGCLWPEETALC